ncbi:Holliday junction branch migration protein RuvA [bacterium]|nr:Holliday junction branch migration protein RuvA [bacterium]
MYKYISGALVDKSVTKVVIDVNGIGYDINIPLSTFNKLPELNKIAKLYTYLYVREDVLRLYGFFTCEEHEFFLLLTSISGIGPKVALGILSSMDVSEFKQAVLNKDITLITKIPGIGRKTAERIVLEIESKIDAIRDDSKPFIINKIKENIAQDVVLALISLGYKQQQAKQALLAVSDLEKIEKMPVGEIVKRSLAVIK